MSTYTTPAAPNLLATLWGPLSEIVTPLLGTVPAVTDPGIPELLSALGEALTAAVRVTRTTAPAPVVVRPAVVRTPARVTTAQVGSVAGEPKPGTLRARLIDHLAQHPGQAYTATELFHALGATSGGAVGAALGTMTAHGEALLVSEAPKRYTGAATTPAPAAPPADTTDPHDDPDQDDTPDPDTAPENAPASDPDTDTPDPNPDNTGTQDPADLATPQAPDAPAPRATRGRKTRS
jgi:hypothetical protein